MDDAFYRRLAEHAGIPYLEPAEVSRRAIPALTAWTARSFGAVPVDETGDTLTLAVADPNRVDVAALGALAGRRVRLAVSTPSAVWTSLDRLFPVDTQPAPRRPQGPPTEAHRRAFRAFAHHAGLEFVELEPATGHDPVDEVAAHLLSRRACSTLRVLPLLAEGGRIVVATDDPFGRLSMDVVAALTGRHPRVVVTSPADLDRALARVFGAHDEGDVGSLAEATIELSDTRHKLGELLLATGLVSESELAEALGLQERTGDRLGHVLLHMGALNETDLTRTLARQLALPEFDVTRFEPDESALRVFPEPLARRHRCAPLAIRDHVLYLAMSDPLDEVALAAVREHTDLPVRIVLAPRTSIELLLQRVYQRQYTEVATLELLNRSPEESAYRRLSWGQRMTGSIVLAVAGLLFFYAPIKTVIGFNILSILFYSSFSLYKFFLIARAIRHDLELPVTADDVLALDSRTLPVYTILVPLYREAAVVEKLVSSIARLDYPPTKLDVKLLIEEDDEETLEKLQSLDLPPYFKLVIVPDSLPKTKPKACNYGLIQAEGKFVVIFDAEDRPDSDQLKKIVVAFSRAEERIVCIQCKLNYFNRTQNVLTRWFTAEYSHWFDLLMPGLDAADAPIPLGGTSNHFIREKLIELGAWDPYNVTEDADLGIRLHKAGFKTAIIDSTTFEEANSDLYNWIRQRSRWVKGYIQTWLVHMRHPILLYRQIGWRSWWSFQFIIGGTFLSFLLNPIYWGLTTIWVATQANIIREIFPGFVYFAGAVGLFLGNFVFTYINVAGCMRRGHHDLIKYALLSPIYWALMSIGAWKGFLQLLYRPHYWEKTVHGLDFGVEHEFVHGDPAV